MRAWLGSAAKVLCAGALFVAAAGLGVLVHLDSPTVLRAVAHHVGPALASTIAGRLTVEGIGALGPTGIEGVDVSVQDPEGRTVLRLDDVHARVSALATLRSLLGQGEVAIEVQEVSAARADVVLDGNEEGTLRIALAFAPYSPAAPGAASRGVSIALPHLVVGHARVHGQIPGIPPVDADVDGLVAALNVTPRALGLDVAHARVTLRSLPGGATAHGAVEAHLAMPSPKGRDLAVRTSWVGTVAAIDVSARVIYDGGEIDAALDVPDATPEELRSVWPLCPFTEVASLQAEAHGTLPRLEVGARMGIGRGAAGVHGVATLGEDVRATLHVEATSIDARAFSASAPHSVLSASADVSVVSPADGAATGEVVMDFAGGTIASAGVPAATLRGRFAHDRSPQGRTSGAADVAVREPGAPTDLALRLVPKADSFELQFEGRTSVARLDGVPRVGPIARGHATARVQGTLDLGSDRLDAEVQATGSDLRVDRVRLREATLVAHTSGPLASPRVDADLHGAGLEAGPLRFATIHAESHGEFRHSPVEVSVRGQDARVEARADVEVGRGVTLRGVDVTLDRAGQRATAKATLVRIASDETRVDDAEIRGLGAPLRATVRDSAGALYVRAHGPRLDLGRIARFAGVQRAASGWLAVDVDALLGDHGGQGRLALDLSEGTLEGWGETKARIDATLAGRRLSGKATATVGDVVSFELGSSALEIGGTYGSWTSWKRALGAVDADVHLDLAKVTALLPPEALPLGPVAGVLDIHAHLRRDAMTWAALGADVVARTTGLAVAGGGARAPWRIEGVDATVRAQIDRQTGRAAVDAQLADAAGLVATLGFTAEAAPIAELYTDPMPLDVVRSIPFQAELTLPPREIAKLPAALGIGKGQGQLQATVRWTGTLLDPTVDVAARLLRGRADVRLIAMPVDLDLLTHYDGGHAGATLRANARGRRMLDASAGLDVRAADVLEALRGLRDTPLPWTAWARATVEGFPLQSLAVLDDRSVRGKASGEFAVDGLHDDAHATLSLTVDGLQVGDVGCRTSSLRAAVDGRGLDTALRVEQDDGFAEVQAKVGARWGSAMAPSIDAARPWEVSLLANQFRVEILEPMVSGLFSQLGGRLGADAHLQIDPGANTVRPEGTMTLRDGAFEMVALGGAFHDVSANATLTPDGIVRLEKVSARGMSGRVEAAATARLDGLGLSGLRAQLQVPQRESLPVVFDGAQVGMFYGTFSVAADRSADRLGFDVNIDVPTLHVQLPLSTAHEVQALGAIGGVRVGRQEGSAGFVEIPFEFSESRPSHALPVRVVVNLGQDVEVKRGTSLDVVVRGQPTFVLEGDVRATGQVRLLSGTIDVQGKKFTLQNGKVTFAGDPTNPQVALTARWTASDGTVVYADFLGPLKTGRVTLRSDPARSKDEIVALILFGTVDESGSTAGGTGAQGLSVIGGAAGEASTQPINRVLDDFGLAGGIRTKIDTSTTTPRPEVELQIARDITLQVAWVLGVPPPGSNPDLTLVTLNWRFLRKWSLETTVGDAGTSIVDFIWQHRY